MLTRSMLTRRRSLMLGAGLVGSLALSGRAFADTIADATISGVGDMVKGTKKDGPYRIGFSNGFSGNTWRTMCTRAVENEAKAQGSAIAEFVVVDGQGDITKQVNDIETLINQQVDAILCIPNSGSAVAPVLAEATREGIVTVPFNLPVDGTDWSTYVGTDPERKGKALGEWLNTALGGKGKIVALGGLPGNSYTAAAWAGAQSALGSGVEVLAFKDAYWEEDRAKTVMADLIAAFPEIDGVWCDGGQVGAGAMKALLAANRPLVPVTGDDYNGLLKMYLAERAAQPKFDIGLMSEPTWQSVVALRAALTLLGGGEVAKQQVIQPQLITKANVEKFVRPDMADGVFVDTNLSAEELKQIFG
ncbi:MAG: substrate-binding domain-containing protein [Geminicoccaceae bacterium]